MRVPNLPPQKAMPCTAQHWQFACQSSPSPPAITQCKRCAAWRSSTARCLIEVVTILVSRVACHVFVAICSLKRILDAARFYAPQFRARGASAAASAVRAAAVQGVARHSEWHLCRTQGLQGRPLYQLLCWRAAWVKQSLPSGLGLQQQCPPRASRVAVAHWFPTLLH